MKFTQRTDDLRMIKRRISEGFAWASGSSSTWSHKPSDFSVTRTNPLFSFGENGEVIKQSGCVLSLVRICHLKEYLLTCFLFITAGVPNLWDLMPDGLRWSWCSNNRNKVLNEFNTLELSPNHPRPYPVHGKIAFQETYPRCQKDLGPLLLGLFRWTWGLN